MAPGASPGGPISADFIAGIFLVKYLDTGRQAVALVPMGFSTTPFRWFR